MAQFNDTTNKTGLIQMCERTLFGDQGYGKITGDSNLLAQFTERMNRALDRFTHLVFLADGFWQYDDSNNTDYPSATTNLRTGIQDYQLTSSFLEIERVLIYPSATITNYQLIKPFDQQTDEARTYLENTTTNVGVPMRYDLKANAIFLDPVPNYNATNGLKVYYKRGPSYFLSTDTTKAPGFPSIFHDYLTTHACFNYASDRQLSMAGGIIRGGYKTGLYAKLSDEEAAINKFFARRDLDQRQIMKGKRIQYL